MPYDPDPGYNDTRGKLPPGNAPDCGHAYCPDGMPHDTTNRAPRNVPYDPDPGYNDTRGKLPPGNAPDCGRAYCPDFMPPTDTTNGAPRNAL
ncbi:hypothetical protein [Streptomyces sp. NPDC017964]|uniref:hypothetical protein n=1 Tax=Streptomyces sp. NPDC017964 TaxID=3365022 RepID=UPI0037B19047